MGPSAQSQPDSATIEVIGGITYLKGNAGGLQNLAGLSASQATEAAGQWIEFATDNSLFSPVVAGVRSSDIAKELTLKGPLALGKPRTLDGYAVDAIEGTQKFGKTSGRVVLYVRARGRPRPGGGGLARGQRSAEPGRARDLLKLGRDCAAGGTAGHCLHRAHQHHVTPGARPNPAEGPLGGKIGFVSRRSWSFHVWRDADPMHLTPMRPPRFSRPHAAMAAAAVLSLLTAAVTMAAVAAAPPAGAASTPSAQSLYQAALKAAGDENVHFASSATQDGVSIDVDGDTGSTSGAQIAHGHQGEDHRARTSLGGRFDRLHQRQRHRLAQRHRADHQAGAHLRRQVALVPHLEHCARPRSSRGS